MTEKEMRQRRRDRDRRDKTGQKHKLGICGPMGSLCYECAKDEIAYLQEASKNFPPPHKGEEIGEYWERVGGRFLDGWYIVALQKYERSTP